MHKIEKIIRVEERKSKLGNKFFRTTAIVNGDEVVGYSDEKDEYKIGDEVESYFHEAWNTAKMQKPRERN